jgi:cytochrome c-type biogenesis protein CcsB
VRVPPRKKEVARLKSELDAARPFAEAAVNLIDRVKLLDELPKKLNLVPDPENPDGDWLSPANAPADKLEYPWVAAGMRLEQAFFDAFASGKGDKLAAAVVDFTKVADAIPGYPSPTKRSVKNMWYRTNPFQVAAWFYLFAAMTFGVATFFESARGLRMMRVLLVVGCITHTAAVLARLYITGHMPVSNMYESVTFVSWAAMMIALVIEFRRGGGVIGFGAATLGFLALIATSFLPLQEVRIHPLRAVLRSYWLNIHVTVMLLSYGAFALAAFFAGCHLVKSFAKRDPLFGKTPLMPAAELEEFAYRLVQVGWPLLTLGIALGAVWAETAWGRYWGWDPKETWAFITWVVYTIYLHTRMVIGWRDRLSSGMCVIGFLMVLLTWFGVSYLPWFAGGLHSYASPT